MGEGASRRAIGVAVAIGIVIWSTWLVAVAGSGFDRDVDGNVLGADHSVFHTAGVLVASGRSADLYDPAGFRDAVGEVRGEVGAREVSFLNPPGLAYLFAPTAEFGRQAAWLVLSALGLVALAGALHLVGVGPVWVATSIVVGTLPALLTLRLGQLAFFWALIFAVVYWLLERDRQVAAGLVAALLMLKPQFAVAVVLWWVVSGPRHRRALVTMIVTGGVVSLAAVVGTPGSFAGFWDAGSRVLEETTFPTGFSIKNTLVGLGAPLPAALVAILTLGLGIGAVVLVHQRCRDDLPAMFAAAVFAAVWIPAHLLAYDWVLLAVAVGALWAARPDQRNQWLMVAAALAVWAFAAWAIALIAHSVAGVRLEIAAVGLAVIAWWSYRSLLVHSATDAAAPAPRTLLVDV